MHTIRNYIMAESLEQAWELNQKGRNNIIIGGNLWLKMGRRNIINAIEHVIITKSIKTRLDEL